MRGKQLKDLSANIMTNWEQAYLTSSERESVSQLS